MGSNFNDQYRSLVDDFREFKGGGCINADSTMNDAAFYSNWPSPGMDAGTGSNEYSYGSSGDGFSSNVLTPSSSSKLSDSPAGRSEMQMSGMIVGHGVFDVSSSEGMGGGVESQDQTAEPDRNEILEDGLPSHRPRKGHKKSRGGCYNCKRRKIKVGSKSNLSDILPHVSRFR